MDRFLLFCLVSVISVSLCNGQTNDTYDYAANQLVEFKKTTTGPIGVMTTNYGQPVEYKHAASSLNTNIFENQYLFDHMSHFNRERVPERGVHAKGTGGYGYFEVTNDVTKYCRAKFLEEVGKKTDIALRFSQSFKDKGSPDTQLDTRGIGIKFYTEEGNFDLTGINAKVFAVADPIHSVSFVHVQKRNPVTRIHDLNAFWDHVVQFPEQLNGLIFTFADQGMPDGYRNMDVYAIHTYETVNSEGDLYYVRFSVLNNQGSNFLLANQSQALQLTDPDYFTRDIYNAIARGDYPSWTLNMQVMTYEETQAAWFDPFSVNKYWPEDEYPLIEVGKLYATRNADNWFDDVEQASYQPGHLVPGINGGVDSTFVARSFIYRDNQYHRIGPNFLDLPVNRARNRVLSYSREGFSDAVNSGPGPNYYPNSFNGPVPYVFENDKNNTLIGKLVPKERPDDNLFVLSTKYYLTLSADSRLRMAAKFAAALSRVTVTEILETGISLLGQIEPELGSNTLGILNGTITVS